MNKYENLCVKNIFRFGFHLLDEPEKNILPMKSFFVLLKSKVVEVTYFLPT